MTPTDPPTRSFNVPTAHNLCAFFKTLRHTTQFRKIARDAIISSSHSTWTLDTRSPGTTRPQAGPCLAAHAVPVNPIDPTRRAISVGLPGTPLSLSLVFEHV